MASSSSQETLDGTNFHFWVENCYNVLAQKEQIKPIKIKAINPKGMDASEWDELDELARSTIMLTLSKNVYFNIKDMRTSFEL